MTDFQFKIKVLNTLIGHFGDRQTSYLNSMKMCCEVRTLLQRFDIEDVEGDITRQIEENDVIHPNAAYDRMVDRACSVLQIERSTIEREAFEESKFDYLEDDRTGCS